ncbi:MULTISPECIES: cupin domain-containing protein [unclassified Halorhabdus]|uniref:cupin domain-containing protein n=1 Tax=unclassified Halorhabdus TaxID=2621901 RepID=UPI0023DBA53A|nr:MULTISPECIES: cupin domain-containing protein [unclassified Halorhabdus]WEL17279.1 putative protein, contains double-stranded beta-helix domain [Halorhabdus sp. SVX81]WEL21161.1 hypothetical protein HBNXHr_1093 [Halorhabdus sp. BNX81]
MTYTKVNYEDVEPVAESMHFLRDALACETVGVTVLDCEPGWSGKAHDHAAEEHEEVYLLVDGEATVTIEGEEVEMESGDAVRVPSEATREIRNGETESTFVLTGAP